MRLSPMQLRQKETARQARDYVRQVGYTIAREHSDREIDRAVNDVEYPFGRIALYQAIREYLDGTAGV